MSVVSTSIDGQLLQKFIKRLVADGVINPAKIEEIHKKVESEFERKIYDEGEKVVIDLGLFPMHDELIKLIGKLKYRASYGQNTLAHSIEVANLAKSPCSGDGRR